jgi:hypothetical protein
MIDEDFCRASSDNNYFDMCVAAAAATQEYGDELGGEFTGIYENVENGNLEIEGQDYYDDDGWGSSEFEDYDDDLSGDQLSVGAKSQDSAENVQVTSTNVKRDNHKQLASGAIKRLGLNRLSWRKSGSSSDTQSIVS